MSKKDRKRSQTPSTTQALPVLSGPHSLRVAAAVVFVAAIAAVGYYRLVAGAGYPLDDSWIHLTYARNLITGGGFGANPGEATPGATSPLWVVLLAPGFLFGDVHAVWPWLLDALVLGGAALIAVLLVSRMLWHDGVQRRGNVPWAALACGLCVALTGPLVWSAAGAMEVPLFVLLVLAAVLAFSRHGGSPWKNGMLWGALAGLAALARPEGFLIITVLTILTLARRTSSTLIETVAGVGAALLVYSPSALFSLATSGRVFPNTFYAKTTSLVAGAPDTSFLKGVSIFWGDASPVSLAAFVAGIIAVVVAITRHKTVRSQLALAAFVVGLPLAYAMMGRTFLFTELAGNFGRYLYPMFAPALVLGFWGIAWLWHWRRATRGRVIILTLFAVAVVASTTETVRRADLYKHNVTDINSMQVAMAQRLGERLPTGSYVAANDVGALSYLTRFRVLDLIGIISTRTLDKIEPAGSDPRRRQQAIYELLLEERPDAIVVFPRWYQPVMQALGESAIAIDEVYNPNNITSGGTRLIAYRLKW